MRVPGRSLGSAFRALFVGSLISNAGDGIRLAALPLLATQLTSSPFWISAVTAAQFLPWVTFGPVGGVLVDRRDRRRTILVTQVWRGLVMLGLGALVLGDVVAIWHLYVVAFLITAGEILVDPSVVALVPTTVEDDQLDTANGRIASVEIVANEFAGAPIGATAFGLAPWLPFVLDGASYLASLLPFRRLPTPDTPPAGPSQGANPPAPATSVRTEALHGVSWLLRHPVLGPLTGATALYYFGASAGFGLLVVLVTSDVGASGAMFGVILAVGALGAFVGALGGSRLAATLGPRAALSGTTLLQGIALIAMAQAESTAQLAVIWFCHGIPAGIRVPIARSMQQRLTPNHVLGRVNVSSRIVTRGVIIVGALASGALATAATVRWSIAVGGAIEVVAAIGTWWALGRPGTRRPS